MKKSSPYSRVCIVNTVYSLLLYLLISSEAEISSTFFFLSDGIPEATRRQLPHYHLPERRIFKSKYLHAIFLLLFKYYAILRWPFKKKAAFFGHDHLMMSPAIIGNNDITLLEDGIGNYSLHPCPDKITLFHKWINGNFCKGRFGYNQNTRKILLTNLMPLPYEDPRVEFINPRELWEKAGKEKQNRIFQYFSCYSEDFAVFEGKETIVFTQPFSEDNFISKEEKVNVYRTILQHYDPEKTIIKTHPREDSSLYKTHFPAFTLFDKKIPMELLSLSGIKFKTAVTAFSTAALNLNYPLQIDWYGTEISDALQKAFGSIPCPVKTFPIKDK